MGCKGSSLRGKARHAYDLPPTYAETEEEYNSAREQCFRRIVELYWGAVIDERWCDASRCVEAIRPYLNTAENVEVVTYAETMKLFEEALEVGLQRHVVVRMRNGGFRVGTRVIG